jgi:alpha-glucosidase
MRHASRYGYDGPVELESGVGAEDPQPDRALGLRRARAATALMLALPGSAYLYQGEELGLPEATDLPDEVRQDPVWNRSGHTIRGRDGCRVPLPWTPDGPSFGFGSSEATWLPQRDYYGEYAVSAQESDETSTLSLYRHLLEVRRELRLGTGALVWDGATTGDTLVLRRGDVLVVANVSGEPVPLPDGEVIAASAPLDGRVVPADTTVWVDTSRTGSPSA